VSSAQGSILKSHLYKDMMEKSNEVFEEERKSEQDLLVQRNHRHMFELTLIIWRGGFEKLALLFLFEGLGLSPSKDLLHLDCFLFAFFLLVVGPQRSQRSRTAVC